MFNWIKRLTNWNSSPKIDEKVTVTDTKDESQRVEKKRDYELSSMRMGNLEDEINERANQRSTASSSSPIKG